MVPQGVAGHKYFMEKQIKGLLGDGIRMNKSKIFYDSNDPHRKQNKHKARNK